MSIKQDHSGNQASRHQGSRTAEYQADINTVPRSSHNVVLNVFQVPHKTCNEKTIAILAGQLHQNQNHADTLQVFIKTHLFFEHHCLFAQ